MSQVAQAEAPQQQQKTVDQFLAEIELNLARANKATGQMVDALIAQVRALAEHAAGLQEKLAAYEPKDDAQKPLKALKK